MDSRPSGDRESFDVSTRRSLSQQHSLLLERGSHDNIRRPTPQWRGNGNLQLLFNEHYDSTNSDSYMANQQHSSFLAKANHEDEHHVGSASNEANHKTRYVSHFSSHQRPGSSSQPRSSHNLAAAPDTSSDRAKLTNSQRSVEGRPIDMIKHQHVGDFTAQKEGKKRKDFPIVDHRLPSNGTLEPMVNRFDMKATQPAEFGRRAAMFEAHTADTNHRDHSKRQRLYNPENRFDQHHNAPSNAAHKSTGGVQGYQQRYSAGANPSPNHSYQRNSGTENSLNLDTFYERGLYEKVPQMLPGGQSGNKIKYPRGILKNKPIVIPDDDETANDKLKALSTATQMMRGAATSRPGSRQSSASVDADYYKQNGISGKSHEGHSKVERVHSQQSQNLPGSNHRSVAPHYNVLKNGNAYPVEAENPLKSGVVGRVPGRTYPSWPTNAKPSRTEDVYAHEQKHTNPEYPTKERNIDAAQRLGFYYDSDSDAECAVEDIMRERNQAGLIDPPKSTRIQQNHFGQLNSSLNSTLPSATRHANDGSDSGKANNADSLPLQTLHDEDTLEIQAIPSRKVKKSVDSRAADFMSRVKEASKDPRPKAVGRADKNSSRTVSEVLADSTKDVRFSEDDGNRSIEAPPDHAASREKARELDMKISDSQRSEPTHPEAGSASITNTTTDNNTPKAGDALIEPPADRQTTRRQAPKGRESATSAHRGKSNSKQTKAVYKQDWSVETVPITEAIELMDPNKSKLTKARHVSPLKPLDSSKGFLNNLRRESQKTAAIYSNSEGSANNVVSTAANIKPVGNSSNRDEGTNTTLANTHARGVKLPKHRGALHPSSITDEDWLLVELRRRGYTWSEVLPEWENVFGKSRTLDWMQKRYRNMMDTFPECETDKFKEPAGCESGHNEREKRSGQGADIGKPRPGTLPGKSPSLNGDHPTTGGKTITKAMERMIREGILESERNGSLGGAEEDIGNNGRSPSPVCDADTVHYAYFVKRRVTRGSPEAEGAWLSIGPTYPTILAANKAAGAEILKEREGEDVWPIGEWSCVCNESTEYLSNWKAKAIDGNSAVEVVVDRILRTWQDGKRPTKQDKTSWLRRLNAWDVWETRTETRKPLNTATNSLFPSLFGCQDTDCMDLDNQLECSSSQVGGKAVGSTDNVKCTADATGNSSCAKSEQNVDQTSLEDDLDALFTEEGAADINTENSADATAPSQLKTVSTRTYPMILAADQSKSQGEEAPAVAIHTTRDSANSVAVRRMMEIRRSIIPDKQRYKIDTITGLRDQQERYDGQLQELEMEAAMEFGPGLFQGEVEWAEWELSDEKRVVVSPGGSKAGYNNGDEPGDKAVAKIDVQVVVRVVRRVLTGPCNI